MEYNKVLENAKSNLNGACRVCPVCNGKACSGEVPGMGRKFSEAAIPLQRLTTGFCLF